MTDDPIVQITTGKVRGAWAEGGAKFLGVPYAEPPFGNLRFQNPVPRRPWEGVLDAVEYGATPQRTALAEITTIPEPSIPGEDTLSVNVFTPAPDNVDAGLPVLVWIHGGGYVAGSPASPWYDGRSFSRDGVVTVTVGYRLGFDGFGWLPDAPHNRGVRDWVLALEWVQQNIRQFGGDPGNVTIAGQSAGGGAILTLLTLPAAEGLFQKAISVSGVPADVPLADAREKTQEIATRLGIEPTGAAFAAVPEIELIAAQGFGMEVGDASDAIAVLTALRGMNGRLGLGPVVDGEYVVATVEEGMKAGRGATVPLIAGATHDEFGTALAAIRADVDKLNAAEALEHLGVDAAVAAQLVAVDPAGSASTVAAQYITDVMFRARMIQWMELRQGSATWFYDFTWKSTTSGMAEHCVDVPFIFDVLDAPGVARVLGDPPAELASDVHAAWVRMLRDGDPGWPRDEVTVLDTVTPDGDTLAGARVLAGVAAA